MTDERSDQERGSKPLPPQIQKDPEEIARLEARNGLRQFDAVVQLIDQALGRSGTFKLRPSMILELNRLAIAEIHELAGVYRPFPIEITKSPHQPPPARDVPRLMEEMCDYVNENWHLPPIHLASYLMWRLNWIHPFADGNGRTARAASYAILCIRLGYRLPGTKTIPEQIVPNKIPYYAALEAADEAWAKEKTVDVSEMERLMGDMLAAQLMDVHRLATGESR